LVNLFESVKSVVLSTHNLSSLWHGIPNRT